MACERGEEMRESTCVCVCVCEDEREEMEMREGRHRCRETRYVETCIM